MIFLSFVLNDNFMFREHLESSHFQKAYVPTLWLFPSSSDFSFRHLYYINEGQTCEKLGRPHCGFFLAAQIFHSDIFTTLMKVQTCEWGKEKGGLFTLRQHIYLH